MRRSGLVESEKIGCSIDAMSPFGAASNKSHTKKSGVGYRSGSSGDLMSFDISPTNPSFDISPTQVKNFRYFTHIRASRTRPSASIYHTQAFDISPTKFRYFTHIREAQRRLLMRFFNGIDFFRNPVTRVKHIFNTDRASRSALSHTERGAQRLANHTIVCSPMARTESESA